MKKVAQLKINIFYKSIGVGVIGLVGSLIIFDKSFWLGWSYGTILGALNWLLLARTMEKAVTYTPNKARMYAVVHYFLRYALVFAALYVAVKRGDMNVIAAVVALFIPKGVILWDSIVQSLFNKKHN